MTKTEALQFFDGSPTKLADALGIKSPSIYDWGEKVPPLRQVQLERVTGGVLKADADALLFTSKRLKEHD